jgi:hypothetical protein
VTFSNCVVYESSRAIGIYCKEGATIEDVTISNIVCDTRNPFMVNRPIQIECTRAKPESKLGKIRNVLISNVICRTDGRIMLMSQPESPLENIVLRDVHVTYPTIDDPDPIGAQIPCGQFALCNPRSRVARGVVIAEHVRNLVVDNLMVTWPTLDAQGRILCPPEWDFPIKAVNGAFNTFYTREQYNTGRIPAFSLLWARDVRGGYFRAPAAKPPRAEVKAHDLADCDLAIL